MIGYQSVVKQGSDLYFLYSFLKRLTTNFEDSKAYKLGIIDEKGKVLRKRRTLKTSEERDSYTLMDTLIFNLKKIMAKIPFGSGKLASYAASLFLLKEQKHYKKFALDDTLLEQEFLAFYKAKEESAEFLFEADATHKLFEQLDFLTEEKKVEEEGPANATGVAVAGTGDDSSTVVVKRRKKKITDISIEDKEVPVINRGGSTRPVSPTQRKRMVKGIAKTLVPQFKQYTKHIKTPVK